eukprot:UN16385
MLTRHFLGTFTTTTKLLTSQKLKKCYHPAKIQKPPKL